MSIHSEEANIPWNQLILAIPRSIALSDGVKTKVIGLMTALMQWVQQGNIRKQWKSIIKDATPEELDALVRIPAFHNLSFLEEVYNASKTYPKTKRYILSMYQLIQTVGDSHMRWNWSWIENAVHSLVEAEDMEAVLENPDSQVVGFLAHNENLTSEIIQKLLSHSDEWIRQQMMKHKRITKEWQYQLLSDTIEKVRMQAVLHYKWSTKDLESAFLQSHATFHTTNVQEMLLSRWDISKEYYHHIVSSLQDASRLSERYIVLLASSPYASQSLREKLYPRIVQKARSWSFDFVDDIPF